MVCLLSAREPAGEKGFIPYERLMPLTPMELEAARAALARGPDVFERALQALLECAAGQDRLNSGLQTSARRPFDLARRQKSIQR